jgi:hypothetical protein
MCYAGWTLTSPGPGQVEKGSWAPVGKPRTASGRRRFDHVSPHSAVSFTCRVACSLDRTHLDSCRRTMSYVRRTTSYNTDVAHDTWCTYDIVPVRCRTWSTYDTVYRCRSSGTYDIVTYDVVRAYDIVDLTYDIVCSHRIRHRMF